MMKCISLWQPWASAMPGGFKRIETRSWKAPTSSIGCEFAIHAAKKWDRELSSFADFLAENGVYLPDLPLGGIVGVGKLVACVGTEEIFNEVTALPTELASRLGFNDVELNLGNYEAGRFGWVFTELRPIEFLPLRGQQGIWTLESEIEREVRARLRS